MGDNRYGQGNHLRNHNQIHLHQQNNPFDLHQNNRVDLYLRSESPRIQQILLHQKLREDIERSADAHRIRYVDSKLHVSNQQILAAKQPATANSASSLSEVQEATLNIGLNNNNHKQQQASAIPSQLQSTCKIPITSKTATSSSTNNSNRKCAGNGFVANRHNCDLNNDQDELGIKLNEIYSRKPRTVGKNCQACLVKEVREDLMKMNKIVQERNDQIIKLKAKSLRSYFERQMLD